MRPDKGHGVLFEALPAILEHCPKTRLVLVGAGPYATAVREKAKSFGDTVDILGERHDVPRLLGASDLFVSPSRNEGLPTVIIEAGAAGLPTVATDVGGTREIVKDQITGILVSPDRPDQLAGAVIRLLQDPLRMRAMGSAAAAHIRSQFTLESQAISTVALYRDALRSQ